MISGVSSKTTGLIDSQFQQIREYGVHIYEPSKESRKELVPSIVLRLEELDNYKIFNDYIELLPTEIKESLIIQPYSGYHITIQWYENKYHSRDVEEVIVEEIESIARNGIFENVRLIYPIFGYYSVYAAIEKEAEAVLLKIRRQITQKFNQLNIPSGIGEDRMFFSNTNLARYSSKIEADSEQLREYIKYNSRFKVKELQYVMSDKFLTERSKVIKTWIIE